MKKVSVIMGAAFLVLCFGSLAGAALVNGDFESGDLTGWTLGGGGGAAVVPSTTDLTDGFDFSPQQGSYFAIVTGAPSSDTYLNQSLALNAGDKLSGYAALDSSSAYLDEYASVKIYDSLMQPVMTAWSLTVGQLQGDYFGFVMWQAWEWTATAAGTYNLNLGVTIQEADGGTSRGYFDYNVLTAAPVPLPGAVWLLGSGLLGLAGWRARKHK